MEQLAEWTTYLSSLKPFHDFHLFVTVLKPDDVERVQTAMGEFSLRAIDVFHNRGMDIGAFLWQAKQHLSTLATYDAILKLHTKTDDRWRKSISSCFLSEHLLKWVDTVSTGGYGWVGARAYLTRSEWGEQEKTRKLEVAAFRHTSNARQRVFVAGSMFLLRQTRLTELLTHPHLTVYVDLCFQKTPVGRTVDDWPHAFERFLLTFCEMKGDKYLGV